jgi:hypothetical protein
MVADVVGFFERVPVEELPGLALPAGAVILWDQSSSCPAGYTRTAAFDGRSPRGAAAPGATGGADGHAHDISHVHGMSHSHGGTTFGGLGSVGSNPDASEFEAPRSSHTHNIGTGGPSPADTGGASATTSSTSASTPPHKTVLFCRKDAPPPVPRPAELGDSGAQLLYTPVAPCRIIDTRAAGGSMAIGTPREFSVTALDLSPQGGSATGCNIPRGRATAALINFVAVNPVGAGNLRAWAYRTPPPAPPNSSVLNYAFVPGAGLNVANGITVPICDPAEPGQPCPLDFRAQADGSSTHLVADVVGFFERFPGEEVPDLTIPVGAVLMWDQSSLCPVGYARAADLDGRLPRGSGMAGALGGSDTHAHAVAHTHGLSSHIHSGSTGGGFGQLVGGGGAATAGLGHQHSFTTGGPSTDTSGGASPGDSEAASNLPPYRDVLFCRKVADPKPAAARPPGAAAPQALGSSRTQLVYTPAPPCRIADTRLAGGALAPGVPRQFQATGTDLSGQGGSATGCDVPFGRATAAIVNFVAVGATAAGNLRAWAFREPPPAAPTSSVLNYARVAGSGLNIANAIALPLCDPSASGQTCPRDFLVQADGGSTHMVADVVGYYERFPTQDLVGLAIPAGSLVLWDVSGACPPGFSRVAAFDGRFPRGAASPGATGGAETHAHGMPHTHDLGSHTHSGTTGAPTGDEGFAGGPQNNAARTNHTHNFTTAAPSVNSTEAPSAAATGSASSLPPYVDVLFCRKD